MVVSVRLEDSFAPMYVYRSAIGSLSENFIIAGVILLCCSVVVACGGGFHLQVGAFGFSNLGFLYSFSSLMVVFRSCAWSDTKGWSSSCLCVGLPAIVGSTVAFFAADSFSSHLCGRLPSI
ncbi:unnamed protein product, partial [Brassica oleracea]